MVQWSATGACALQTPSAATHRLLSHARLGGRRAACSPGLVAPNLFETSTSCRSACSRIALLVIAALLRDRASILHGRFRIAAWIVFLAADGRARRRLVQDVRRNSADTRSGRATSTACSMCTIGEGRTRCGCSRTGTTSTASSSWIPTARPGPQHYGLRSASGSPCSTRTSTRPCGWRGGPGRGDLAAYGRTGDVLRFYDIIPRCRARPLGIHFSQGQRGEGGGRASATRGWSLEREAAQDFDVPRARRLLERRNPRPPVTSRLQDLSAPSQAGPGNPRGAHLQPLPRPRSRGAAGGAAFVARVRQVESDDDDEAGVYRSDWMLLSPSPRLRGRAAEEAAHGSTRCPA